jgi:transposase-like protein
MNYYDYGNGRAPKAPAAEPDPPPAVCPACKSSAITTTSRKSDEHAYWRCGGCGEIWNAARRGSSPSRDQRWR